MRDVLTVRSKEELDYYKEFVKTFKAMYDKQAAERGIIRTYLKRKCLKCGKEYEGIEKTDFCFDCHCENM